MKKVLFLIITIIGLNSVSSGACEAHADPKSGSNAKEAQLKSDSIYNASGSWRNTAGAEMKLSSFRGKNVIVTMAFTHCTFTCPLVVAKLKEIEKQLKANEVTDYRIVIASFDPTRDTPERLAAYMKEKNIPASHWTLLSPKSDKEVRELAAVLGVTYSKDRQGDYSHSNIISILDREGIVVEKINGIAADHEPLVASLVSAAKK